MKNYYKRGIAPKDRWFITGYQKGIRVDEFGNVIEVLEVRMADGHYEVYDYSNRVCHLKSKKKWIL